MPRGPSGIGGGGGIRTPGTREGTSVFKTGAFNHSATPPERGRKNTMLLRKVLG